MSNDPQYVLIRAFLMIEQHRSPAEGAVLAMAIARVLGAALTEREAQTADELGRALAVELVRDALCEHMPEIEALLGLARRIDNPHGDARVLDLDAARLARSLGVDARALAVEVTP